MTTPEIRAERAQILKKSKGYTGKKLHRAAIRLGELRCDEMGLSMGLAKRKQKGC